MPVKKMMTSKKNKSKSKKMPKKTTRKSASPAKGLAKNKIKPGKKRAVLRSAKALPTAKSKASANSKKSASRSLKKGPKAKVAPNSLSSQFNQAPRGLKGKEKKYYELLMKIRANLLGQVQVLSKEALLSDSAAGKRSGTSANHLADYGSDNFLHGMELDIMSGEMEDLEMIDEALERLANGEYGKCLDCGSKIPSARLEVKPHARFCVKCKELHERDAERIEFER